LSSVAAGLTYCMTDGDNFDSRKSIMRSY
jgi:hypothetical protein